MAARALERVQNEKKVTKTERVGKKKWRQSKCHFMTFLLEIWNELFFLLIFWLFLLILSNMIQMMYSINFFLWEKIVARKKKYYYSRCCRPLFILVYHRKLLPIAPKKGSPSQNWWLESCLLRRRVILQGIYLIPYHISFQYWKLARRNSKIRWF